MNRGSQKDGGYGWVVVFAFFTSSIIIDSLRYAFGLLYVEFLEEFQLGNGVTGGISSVLLCVYNILGPIYAAVINRFGVRVSALAGSVIGTVGLVTSSFASQLYPLYFTYSLIQGIGLGIMYLAGWVAVSRYFDKRRGLALGIAQCGCGVGAFAISPLLKMFIDEYTWRGAMLILAGVCLNGCVLAMLYRPFVDTTYCTSDEIKDSVNEVYYEQNNMIKEVHDVTRGENKSILLEYQQSRPGYKHDIDYMEKQEPAIPKPSVDMREEQLNNYKQITHTSSLPCTTWSSNRSIHTLNISPDKRNIQAQLHADDFENNTHILSETHKQFSLSLLEKLFPRKLVTNTKMILLMSSLFFYCMPTFIPISLLPDYGRIVGCDESEVAWFVSAIGIGGTIGRFLCGIVVDIACINRIWFMGAMLLICSLSSLVLPLLTSFISLMTVSLIYGLGISSIYVVPLVILMDLFGEELIPQSIGVCLYISGLAAILGVPSAGWLFDATQSYTASFLFCGGLFMCSVIFNMFVLCVPNKQHPEQIDEEKDV